MGYGNSEDDLSVEWRTLVDSRRWIGIGGLVLMAGIGTWLWLNPLPFEKLPIPAVHNPAPMQMYGMSGQTKRVMVVGGSVALGWDDKQDGGYLNRAFQALSQSKGIHFDVINKSVEGEGPGQYAPNFATTLATVNPQILVISWGMLDDASNHTPILLFRQWIRTEISLALKSHQIVVIITPPVTEASYSEHIGTLQDQLVDYEMSVAKTFHSNHVYIFDLFHEMMAYIKMNHLNIDALSADNWHPNTAGHALAAKLLVGDLNASLVDIRDPRVRVE